MRRQFIQRLPFLTAWSLAALMALTLPLTAFAKTTDEERRIGKDAAEELAKDKTVKFVTDPAYVERIERIGNAIAPSTDEPDLKFTFHIIDTSDINAFSLPGGYLYFNKGLVDACESDDELAGVVGHEMAHSAHHHLRQLMAKQRKLDWATLAIILAGAATGKDVGNLATLSQVITLARVNGYGMGFETEADKYAVEYLAKSPYNPVGMLTFMERLAHDEAWKGSGHVDMGIYQTHPLSADRVQALITQLKDRGITIDRRKVTSTLQVITKDRKIGDQNAGEVWLGKVYIATVAADGAMTATERAQAIGQRLDLALDQRLGVMDVRLGPDGRTLWAGRSQIMTVTTGDAQLVNKTEEEFAKQIEKNVQNVLWKHFYNSIY